MALSPYRSTSRTDVTRKIRERETRSASAPAGSSPYAAPARGPQSVQSGMGLPGGPAPRQLRVTPPAPSGSTAVGGGVGAALARASGQGAPQVSRVSPPPSSFAGPGVTPGYAGSSAASRPASYDQGRRGEEQSRWRETGMGAWDTTAPIPPHGTVNLNELLGVGGKVFHDPAQHGGFRDFSRPWWDRDVPDSANVRDSGAGARGAGWGLESAPNDIPAAQSAGLDDGLPSASEYSADSRQATMYGPQTPGELGDMNETKMSQTDGGVGTSQQGLSAGDTATNATGNDPTGAPAEAEYATDSGSGGEYAGKSDEWLQSELDRTSEMTDMDRWDALNDEISYRETRSTLGNSDPGAPDSRYVKQVADATGLSEEEISSDYERGYVWGADTETGEWVRFSLDDMRATAAAIIEDGYDRGDNPYVDRVLDAIAAGRVPSQADMTAAREYLDDDDLWMRGFAGRSKTDLLASGEYGSGEDTEEPGRNLQDELAEWAKFLRGELESPGAEFDDTAMREQSALAQSRALRAAQGVAGAQRLGAGAAQGAASDIALQGSTDLEAAVADRKFQGQIAESQRKLAIINQAMDQLNTQIALAASQEEAAAMRSLQEQLSRMQFAQQKHLMKMQADMMASQSLAGGVGGVLGSIFGAATGGLTKFLLG